VPARRTPLDFVKDAGQLAGNALFWKIMGALATAAATLLWHLALGEQQKLEKRMQKLEVSATGFEAAHKDHLTEEAQLKMQVAVLQQQLRLLGRRHVEAIAGEVRHQNVNKTLAIYDQLVQHWPCSESDACLPPPAAAETALSRRIER